MDDKQIKILHRSTDPDEIRTAAQTLAASSNAEDHQALKHFLTDTTFLDRLDSPRDYQLRPAHRLRLGRVLDVLSRNPAASAKGVLVELTTKPPYNDDETPSRGDILISACATIRPAPPAVVAYWDRHAKPDDAYSPITIEAILENGSPPALALLEKKMADPGHDEESKTSWMRSSLLPRRNDLAVLRSCRRMLAGGLPEPLRAALVEVLFDYKPTEWYPPSSPVKRPARQLMADDAKTELRAIGEMVLEKVKLSEEQKLAVKAVLKELGGEDSRP